MNSLDILAKSPVTSSLLRQLFITTSLVKALKMRWAKVVSQQYHHAQGSHRASGVALMPREGLKQRPVTRNLLKILSEYRACCAYPVMKTITGMPRIKTEHSDYVLYCPIHTFSPIYI